MKQIILFFLFFIVAHSLLAQSGLHISTTNNIPIQLCLDKRYFKKHNTSLTIGNLPPGKHSIQVYAYHGDSKSKSFSDVIFEGTIKTNKGEMATCVVDPDKATMTVYRSQLNADHNSANSVTDDYSTHVAPVDTMPVIPAANENVMSKNDLNKIAKQVDAKITDTDKMKEAKNALNGKSVSTAQVRTMMSWYNFEKSRLEFIEWIYPNVVDKEQYSKLGNSFTFKSSKKDLEDFLKSNQH